MTNTQLLIMIGVPVICNAMMVTLLIASHGRFSVLNGRLDALHDVYQVELLPDPAPTP